MTPREWWLVCDAKTIKVKAELDAVAPGPKFSKQERDKMQAMHDKAKGRTDG